MTLANLIQAINKLICNKYLVILFPVKVAKLLVSYKYLLCQKVNHFNLIIELVNSLINMKKNLEVLMM